MKILVIGLEGAAPELLFGDESLTNLRRLMDGGCYGKLESVIPPTAVPAWLCMATSQDPGSLGIYGTRNRADRSYKSVPYQDMELTLEGALWAYLGKKGKRSFLMGVPAPPNTMGENTERVGGFTAGGKDFPRSDREQLKDNIYAAGHKNFETIRRRLKEPAWDYFQFIESGLDRLQHRFWQFYDPLHEDYRPGNPYENVIPEYYLYLDDEIGKLLELLDEETVILAISPNGSQKLHGLFCINEWLLEEGLLVLNEYPDKVTSFCNLNVDWERTKAWSEGECCASIFFNVKGREPNGTVEPSDYEAARDAIKARLANLMDEEGKSLGILASKPEEIFKMAKGVAPDLILQVRGDFWRADDGVGYRNVCFRAKSAWKDCCAPTNLGCFILAADNNPLQGEIKGTHLLDIAPTLLEIVGHEIPEAMKGKSLLSGKAINSTISDLTADEEEAVRKRLSGLGYI